MSIRQNSQPEIFQRLLSPELGHHLLPAVRIKQSTEEHLLMVFNATGLETVHIVSAHISMGRECIVTFTLRWLRNV